MVSKDECVNAINNFIKSKNVKDVIVLLEYLCEIKQLDNIEESIKIILSSPVLPMIIPYILEALERELNIVRVCDRYNTLILVY